MFKNQFSSPKTILFGVLLFMLLVSCSPPVNENHTVVVATQLTTSEPTVTLLTTRAIGLTPTIITRTTVITPTRTQTLAPINPPTVTPSPTLLPTKTITPWPTLSPDEAANKVITLFTDNQNPNCLLPCWWGAIPGETRWLDIEPFLKSFASRIYYSSRGASFSAEVIMPLPTSYAIINVASDYHAFYGWDGIGIIYGIYIDPINISGYDPRMMVTLYGIPDEVWLHATGSTPTGVLPFQLIMVYQERGISFRYYVEATTNGETLTACFEPGVEIERPELFPAGPRIYLWVPGEYKTIEEISPIPWETYFPLESKTDLTVQSFYDRFMNPDEPPCIDTPADLW